jgi:hypothetical protein
LFVWDLEFTITHETPIPFNPAFPVINLMTASIPTTRIMMIVHIALALAVRPSISKKMISMAANFTFAEIKKMTALIVVMALIKKKAILEKKAVRVRGKTTRVKVLTGFAPRLTAASSIDLSICFRLAMLERTPKVKLQMMILMMMIQNVP